MKLSKLLIYASATLSLLSATVQATEWQAKSFDENGFTLPYQIYQPTSTEQIPLIIHLHGSGEAGVDNQAQLYLNENIGPDYFASEAVQSIQHAIVLAPQTPEAMRWANTTLDPYDFKTTPSTPSMTALLKLIDDIVANNPKVDPNRIYMTGLSRGGQGVWNAAMQRPELFAAIVPIAGSASPKDAKLLTKIPVWAFHGSNDSVTNIEYTRDMIDAIIKSGGTSKLVRYTEIEGGEHQNSWLTAFQDTKLYQWMLAHQNN